MYKLPKITGRTRTFFIILCALFFINIALVFAERFLPNFLIIHNPTLLVFYRLTIALMLPLQIPLTLLFIVLEAISPVSLPLGTYEVLLALLVPYYAYYSSILINRMLPASPAGRAAKNSLKKKKNS